MRSRHKRLPRPRVSATSQNPPDSLWRAQSDSRIWQEIHAHMRMEDYRSVWLRDHEAISEAVSAGNARKASAAMTRHLGNIRDALMEASNAKSMVRDKT